MCLQDSSYNGVGPEALCGSVLRFHLLGFGGRVRITGIQHGLQYTPAGIDKPFKERQEREKKTTLIYKTYTRVFIRYNLQIINKVCDFVRDH